MISQSADTYILYTYTLLNFIFLCEIVYSSLMQDGIYTPFESLTNVLTDIVRRFILKIDGLIFLLVVSYFVEVKTGSIFILQTIFAVIIADFVYYFYHYFHHTNKVLWSFHHVHHSGYSFNMSTSLRMSWMSTLYSTFILTGPLILLGFTYSTALTAVAITNIVNNISHSAYIRMPLFFEYIFITPRLHKIHHDQKNINQNSNLGGVFSIWDRMFGTYVADINWKEYNAGIQNYIPSHNIMKIQVDPIVNMIQNK